MDGLTLSSITSPTANSITTHFFSGSILHTRRIFRSKSLISTRKLKKVSVFASNEETSPPKLNQWELMDLKFGSYLGEDPKLTLAKIMGRRLNPDVSYLEIEESFRKKKGKVYDIEEIPFDVSTKRNSLNSKNKLNLVRPVPKNGIKFDIDDKESKETKDTKPNKQISKPVENSKSSVPNVILRKPTVYSEDETGSVKASRFNMTPNLTLNMYKVPEKTRFSDMTLLKKPEPVRISSSENEKSGHSSDAKSEACDDIGETSPTNVDVIPLKKPEFRDLNQENDQEQETVDSIDQKSLNLANAPGKSQQADGNYAVEHPGKGLEQSARQSFAVNNLSETKSADPLDVLLLGKPERLDQPKQPIPQKEVIPGNFESNGSNIELGNFVETSPIKGNEDYDWKRAEDLVKTGDREKVELISCSTKGFVVSFGSLVGFLPYRNLAMSWKFLAFESWLRTKGLDPSVYKQNRGVIIRNYEDNIPDSSESRVVSQNDKTLEISPDMKLEKLLGIYDQEKLKFLTGFVGETVKVEVVLADKKSKRLTVSMKPKENEELTQKKRSLMAKLRVGDIVKCSIKKITFFGIFVEVEGVTALVPQAEVSWDDTLDPASYFKIGQIVDAKIHQLDFSLDRIFLSLKEITPDPLMEALEAIVGDHNRNLEAAQPDAEWADVEYLIRELQQFEGIISVSKGRYFLSPGLAPTFQVYMASTFENQYKLLARSGNRVQEVIVEASLSKEDMKSAILVCANKVE